MDETLQQGVNLTNQQIAEALSYGVPEEDIYNHLRQSADPHHMEVVRRYDMAKGSEKFNAQPQQQQTAQQSVNTGIVDWMSEHPAATIAGGLGATALLGTGAYALKTGVVDPWATGRQEAAKLKAQAQAEPSPAIKVQQDQNALAARRLDLEAQQMQNSASIADNVKPAQEMSPFDAAKLKEQELRNQKLQIAIDNLKAEEARKQAVHEANQAAAQAKKAAQTKQTTGGTITETEAGMLAADQTAKIQKAIDADQKAAAAKAAIPAQTAPAPVAPTPSPTVQLTPSPEVAAEVTPKNPLEGTKQLKTGTGKAAFAGGAEPTGKFQSSYKDISAVPKTHAFIPEGQMIDMLRNALNQETYTQHYTGKEFPKNFDQALQESKDINKSLGRMTREEALAQGIPKEKIGTPTPGILQKVNNKTAVRVGGLLGALAAIPNLSQAAEGAQEKDVKKAYGSLVQGVSQFLGPIGAIGGELFGISPEELETLRAAEKSRKSVGIPPR